MIIIGICGRIGSGKDAVADILVRQHNFKKVVMSEHALNPELQKLGIPISREAQQKLSPEYKAKYGNEIWAKKSIEYAKAHGWDKVVVSGIRDLAEPVEFKKHGMFILVFVDATPEVRFKRLVSRSSLKDVKSVAALVEQEKGEEKTFESYNSFEQHSDYKIVNNGTFSHLEKEVNKFVAKYGLNK